MTENHQKTSSNSPSKIKQIASFTLIAIVLLNLALFAFTIYGPIPFWIIIAVAGILAYTVIPKIK